MNEDIVKQIKDLKEEIDFLREGLCYITNPDVITLWKGNIKKNYILIEELYGKLEDEAQTGL